MPSLRPARLVALVGLLACDPEDAGEPDGTSGGAADTGATDTDAPGPDAGEPIACPDARWEHLDTGAGEFWALAADSRGHLRAQNYTRTGEWRLIDLDPAGAHAGGIALDPELWFIHFGGVDDGDHAYLALRDRADADPRQRLRKVDTSGALVWEVDVGPAEETLRNMPAVGPDGSTVVTEQSKMSRRDADGALVWQRPRDPGALLTAVSLNAGGAIAAIELTTARIWVLEPDGSPRWIGEFGGRWAEYAFLDDAGEVIASSDDGVLARFAADGALLWERTAASLGLAGFLGLAMNAAGEVALIGHPTEGPGTQMITLDAAGEAAVVRGCTGASVQHVAIDADGAVYVAGYVSVNFDAWAAAFD